MDKANLVVWNLAIGLVAASTLCPTRAEAQSMFDAGSSCGCPDMTERDTVWVTDNGGAGVGTATWSCDHTYVLTEQVFVNAMDTLTIEPGTAILGMEGSGRSEFTAPTGNEDVGYVLSASYDVYPGALVVARGGFLSAEGTPECPIQCSFLGDPLDGSVGLDVQGRWGGIVMCGGAAINTLYLEGIDLPFLTGGIGTGEDRAEGIVDVSGQDRHVYGGNVAPEVSSGVLRYMSIRHGSTNLGWNTVLNGNETDLLQLAGCGTGTLVDHVELIASADDGLHILGGTPDIRHVMSAFHAEDAFESDQGWQGSGQFLLGIQDTTLSHATNPPMDSFLWMMHGDDFEENNVDPTYEPYTSPWMSNLTMISNGGKFAVTARSLPAGDWLNSVVEGVSRAGIQVRHNYSCDGFPALAPMSIPGGYGILRLKNWRVWGTEEAVDEVEPAKYTGIYASGVGLALPQIIADSNNVLSPMLLDASFEVTNGVLVSGIDPRPINEATVSTFYQSVDERLQEVTYHGAFAPQGAPWFEGWSMLDAQGLFSGSVPGPGCTYMLACNYDDQAVEDDGSCDFTTCAGCTSSWACNYSPEATLDDGSCEIESCSGCTYAEASNFDPSATVDNGSCQFVFLPPSCTADLNQDGVVSTLDLLDFLSVYGSEC